MLLDEFDGDRVVQAARQDDVRPLLGRLHEAAEGRLHRALVVVQHLWRAQTAASFEAAL